MVRELDEAYADLCAIPRMTPPRLRRLVERFESPQAALGATVNDLSSVEGLDERLVNDIRSYRRSERTGAAIARACELGAYSVDFRDERYPSQLAELKGMPAVLFVRGELGDEDRLAVAVVGMRRPSHYGQEVAGKLGHDLARHGVTVVSGMARGVDTCAHRGALAGGGRTLAVLGCGIDTCYPPENRKLAEEIAGQGAVMTEFGPGTEPLAMNFPKRNRVVSGLSRAIIAVEAAERSGVLNTAAWAADQGRDVYAVPGRVTDERSAGTNRLLKEGARPLTAVEDVLRDLGLALHYEERAKLELEDDEKPVLDALTGDPQHVDELCQSLGIPMSVLLGVLMRLEVKGVARQLPGKFFVRQS